MGTHNTVQWWLNLRDKHAKIFLSVDKAIAALRRLSARGYKIVLTQGSFDLLHYGHVRYLSAAKKYGDILVVAVDNDSKVKQRKGPGRPIVRQNHRMELLAALRSVDLVVLRSVALDDAALTAALKPDILVTTEEAPVHLKDRVLTTLTKIVTLPRQGATSTSSIAKAIALKATAVASITTH